MYEIHARAERNVRVIQRTKYTRNWEQKYRKSKEVKKLENWSTRIRARIRVNRRDPSPRLYFWRSVSEVRTIWPRIHHGKSSDPFSHSDPRLGSISLLSNWHSYFSVPYSQLFQQFWGTEIGGACFCNKKEDKMSYWEVKTIYLLTSFTKSKWLKSWRRKYCLSTTFYAETQERRRTLPYIASFPSCNNFLSN